MTPDLGLSLAKIAGSILLLAGVLTIVSRLARAFGLHPELARKLIHVSLGLYCLSFPWIFTHSWEVAATCALAVGLFALVRRNKSEGMGEGLHGVNRISYGEILFALSVALLFHLKDGHWINQSEGRMAPGMVLYVLPLLTLTLCDAAAAMVGANYGKARFQVEAGLKSWEGVATFFITAWLVALIALLLFSDVRREHAILLAFITALFGALLEAASWRGLDNLFIPMGLYFMLANLLPRGTWELVGAAQIFAGLTALGLFASRRFQISRHAVATAMSLFFCIAIFSGLDSTLAPAAAFVAYLWVKRFDPHAKESEQELNLIIALLAISIGWYVVGDLSRFDVIFLFNLSFAALAAATVAYFGPSVGPGWLAAAGSLAWLVMLVRTLLGEGFSQEALTFSAAGAALIALAMIAARLIRRWAPQRTWCTLIGVSFAAGLAGWPLSPVTPL